MNITMKNLLTSISLEEIQSHNNMSVIPMFSNIEAKIDYLNLKKALETGLLEIKEVDEGGSVPDLLVINKGNMPVLLIDGEELQGAKQNRVLNTSILLKENSETKIPVSCTEAGRWEYRSREFSDSGHFAHSELRAKKMRSVANSLNFTGEFRSNQSEVWDEISTKSEQMNFSSGTGAARDMYENFEGSVSDYIDAFPILAGQRGLFVFINGKIAGFDYISQEDTYLIVHQKFVKSYTMEAIMSKSKDDKKPALDKVQQYLESLQNVKEDRFDSVGYGYDYRYEGAESVGSSLIHQDEVIHSAFFKIESATENINMSDLKRRRSFRI